MTPWPLWLVKNHTMLQQRPGRQSVRIEMR